MSLVLRAGAHLCALDLRHVIETMRPLPIRPLAGAPAFVIGISIVRGEPTPVIDVATLVGGPRRPPTRYVTVSGGRLPIALAVESVLGVRTIPKKSWRELPPLLDVVDIDVINALGAADDQPLLALDTTRMLSDPVWSALESEVLIR
jgi:purine-binding chemotaxis protein CheW